MSAWSYRVAYRRGNGKLLTRHYETWTSALRRYRIIASIEELRRDGYLEGLSYEHMEPLTLLRIEQRRVEPWEPVPYQPAVTDLDRGRARTWADREHKRIEDRRTYEDRDAPDDGFVF